MPQPVYAPRVNNNDDSVQVVQLSVQAGDRIKVGDSIAEVETDKAVLEVVAEHNGYVLQVLCDKDERVEVGSTMMWIGSNPDEPVPEVPSRQTATGTARGTAGSPTAKARALLETHNLRAEEIPCQGDRLTAGDIEAFLSAKEGERQGPTTAPERGLRQVVESLPNVPGNLQPLTAEEHGMASTVTWHRDHAVATYLEMEYDPRPWEDYADAFAEAHKLMLSPLLPLMAYRLVEITRNTPKINCTLVKDQKYRYDQINLGFTVQVGETLYLTVTRQADRMDARQLIDALGQVQRRAMSRRLQSDELQGATVGFSSMARWKVNRHVPVLAPYTSLMVAHAAPGQKAATAVLGASYDHRVLNGYDVARVLTELSQPPTAE
jgi:pyruvate dehydrogenase E2 component (dihydrolipoamide acetyltransferase)